MFRFYCYILFSKACQVFSYIYVQKYCFLQGGFPTGLTNAQQLAYLIINENKLT